MAQQVGRREGTPETEGDAKGGDVGQSALEAASGPSPPFNRAFWFWGCSLLMIMLLCLPVSAWLWEISRLDALLTYPWQILAMSGLPLAFLAGSVLRLDRRFEALPAWAGVVALVVLASYPYLAPRHTQVDPGSEPVALLQTMEAEAPQIMLPDYDIGRPPELAETQTLTLTLAWQVVEPVAEDYTVFVHVLAEDGTQMVQRDTRPCDGECPTNTWQPGEVIIDRYQLDLTQDTGTDASGISPQLARLAVGLYLLESGDRALVVGQEDRTVFLDVR